MLQRPRGFLLVRNVLDGLSAKMQTLAEFDEIEYTNKISSTIEFPEISKHSVAGAKWFELTIVSPS